MKFNEELLYFDFLGKSMKPTKICSPAFTSTLGKAVAPWKL